MACPSVSVVIPARNEVGVIGPTIKRLQYVLGYSSIPYEIIVVVDDDETGQEAVDRHARVFANKPNGRYGSAVRIGILNAKNDWVVVMVADGSDSPYDLVDMVRRANPVEVFAVFGHRFVPRAIQPRVIGYPRLKLYANRAGNRLAAWCVGTGYTDLTNPFKLYRRDVAQELALASESPGMSYGFELALRFVQRGLPYAVLPTSWEERRVGSSKFDRRQAWGYLKTLWNVVIG